MDGMKKKRSHFFNWWRIEPEELQEQLIEYNAISPFKAYRKVSSFLLILSAIITAAFVYFGKVSSEAVFDIVLMSIISIFVFRGHKWALVAAMILWTLEKVFAIAQMQLPLIQIVWWGMYMKFFYVAWMVEKVRAEQKATAMLSQRLKQ